MCPAAVPRVLLVGLPARTGHSLRPVEVVVLSRGDHALALSPCHNVLRTGKTNQLDLQALVSDLLQPQLRRKLVSIV